MVFNYRKYLQKLESRGYKKVGQGFFAVVFAKPDRDYVIKIYADEDEGYNCFLNMIMERGKNNPHFPKIYSIKNLGNGFRRVKMEKLQPFEEYNTDHPTVKTLRSTLRTDKGDFFNEVFKRLGENKRLKKSEIYKAVNLVLDVRDYEGGSLDLHNGNIMFRKLGKRLQLVITDPLTN